VPRSPEASGKAGASLRLYGLADIEGSEEDFVAGLESGSDDYLTKLFNVEELKARLRTSERTLQLEDKLVEAREKPLQGHP
jgi:DNA-binding response OmpR family regulator